ncbi:MAG TPA: hypothetical protein VNW92_07615, partial [Polyangiaceae bacterium]|nr:hypothetical protein [Polyangiaceae bacterium]
PFTVGGRAAPQAATHRSTRGTLVPAGSAFPERGRCVDDGASDSGEHELQPALHACQQLGRRYAVGRFDIEDGRELALTVGPS